MPRDPRRIDPTLVQLGHAWRANPDMRLTQLVWNLARPIGESAPKFFNTEDDALQWLEVPVTPPSIKCPKCHSVSYNTNDVRTGYCGRCHEYTQPL